MRKDMLIYIHELFIYCHKKNKDISLQAFTQIYILY